MRRIGTGIRARLVTMPDDTRMLHVPDCVDGTVGILELWESEHRPGRYGAAFHWPIDTEDDGHIACTSRYFRTTPTYDLHITGASMTLERDGNGSTRRYGFSIIGAQASWLVAPPDR